MKPTYIPLLLLVVSTTLFAQRVDVPWQINAGVNIIDVFPTGEENQFFPNQGAFFEDFANTDHWNVGVPSIGIYYTLVKDLSLGVNFAYAGITKIQGQEALNLKYYSSDLQFKYAFFRGRNLRPYLRAGAGVSAFNNDASLANNLSAQNRLSDHLVGTIGFDLRLSKRFGFYVESNFKKAFGDDAISHFNHSLGFSFGLGTRDKDKDGVPDSKDECIDVPGPVALNGCPDSDGDGILDREDNCPEAAGPEDNAGCPWPDQDGDEIADKEDLCPEEAGPAENNGCPWPDLDGDGVADKDDECPEEPGLDTDNGCPFSGSANSQAVNNNKNFNNNNTATLGSNILFPANSAQLLGAKNNSAIYEILSLLEADPTIRLIIEGHTSSEGTESYNLRLSAERALSIRMKLMALGVDHNRLQSVGYGKSQPVDSNATEEGRARNRRVAFKPQKQ